MRKNSEEPFYENFDVAWLVKTFFRETMTFLEVVTDMIQPLQISTLPFMPISLLTGLGRLY
jgi:hypothetical protein